MPKTLTNIKSGNTIHLYSWGSNFLSHPSYGQFPPCFKIQSTMQWSWKTWSHFPNLATQSSVLFAERHWMHWSMMWNWQIWHFSISVSYAHVAIQKIFFTSNIFLGLFRGAWILGLFLGFTTIVIEILAIGDEVSFSYIFNN